MSRCTAPCRWAKSSASAASRVSRTASSTELPLPPEPVAQALALDVRHGEPEPARGLARVVDREDVGVLQPGGEADLPEEALGAERRGELGVEHLERHRPVVAEVVGEADRGHAAAAELALERVPVLQSRAEGLYRVRHRSLVMGIRGEDLGEDTGAAEPGEGPVRWQ